MINPTPRLLRWAVYDPTGPDPIAAFVNEDDARAFAENRLLAFLGPRRVIDALADA